METMTDRQRLNNLQTEYQKLKALDRDSDAARRYELRDEVSKLWHLMGPEESGAWTEMIGPYETVAEYEAEAASERLIGEVAIEGLARNQFVSDAEQSFMPPDWKERVAERREEIHAEAEIVDVDQAVAAAEAAAEALADHQAREKKTAADTEAAAQTQHHHHNALDQALGQSPPYPGPAARAPGPLFCHRDHIPTTPTTT